MLEKDMPNSNDFAQIIEDMVRRSCGRLQYKEAICLYAEKNEINIEDVASLVNSRLKAKLRTEAENLHYLPKSAKLPI